MQLCGVQTTIQGWNKLVGEGHVAACWERVAGGVVAIDCRSRIVPFNPGSSENGIWIIDNRMEILATTRRDRSAKLTG